MGTELLRARLKADELEFPAVPPGFESFTSFKLTKVEDAEDEPCCSSSLNKSNQESTHVKAEPGHGSDKKTSRPRRRRSGVNYDQDHCSDEDSDSEHLCQNLPLKAGLPKGVIRGCADCQQCQKVVARWHPKAACRPDLEDVPVFYPSEEEFKDAIRYINKIREKAEQYGICRIVPPPSWKPACPLKEKELWEKSKFSTRIQRVDKLQNRESRKMSKIDDSHAKKKRRRCSRMGVESGVETGKSLEKQEVEFGFEPGPDFTLDEFQRYADDFKAQYFMNKNCTDVESANSTEKWEPSVEIIEGEYWRVVEKPTEEIEVLYGADLETGVFGSGFPKSSGQGCSSSDEEYVKAGWNLNNVPRLPGSVLLYENADISGVQVPWLYAGMCFSSFCWHVEDHHLYSLNYMHFGAPKLWYGVPGSDAIKMEDAMRKRLPDLFDEQPDLLHKLVTQLSPSILKSAGVPVYRCVQNAGEFVMTFPRAYHAGFNCGFNCAEAVNVAPIDWLPHGQNAVELYREQGRKTTVSHDKLLLGAARDAVKANWELNLLRKNTVDNLRWKEACGKDGILAKSFRARVELENVRREFLCKYSKDLKMESGFDSTTERECTICSFDLHLSAAGCHCSPDRFACLNHTKQMCPCGWDQKFFLFRYDISELNILVDALEGKLSSIYRWARLDLGLALSSCISKDNTQAVAHVSQQQDKNFAMKGNSQPLVTSKGVGSIVKTPTDQNAKVVGFVLALVAPKIPPKIPPIKLSRQKRENDHLPVKKARLESQMKSSIHEQCDLICLDDEDDHSNKPLSDEAKETSEAIEGSNHKLNLCDLANAALAAEAKSNVICYGRKDDCLSSSTSPKDGNGIKCHTSGGLSLGSSIGKRDPEASTPDGCDQNRAYGSRLGQNIKMRDDSPTQRGDVKLLDDTRMHPGSPSCSHSSVDKYPRQKGPRIAKVVRRFNSNVELLELGLVIPSNLWSNSRAIFPKGFKSRVRYINISDPTNMCSYISEILDGGSKGPLFMVYSEHCSSEVFVHLTPSKCWETVRERINQEIAKQHKLGNLKLPPMQPPGSLDGLEMFGFTSPTIIQGIEGLDKNRVSTEYWSSRPLAQVTLSVQPSEKTRNPGCSNSEAASPGTDTILSGLFKKANPEELESLMNMLGNKHTFVISLLNEEIQNRSS